MKITELQYASLVISLSTLGQTRIEGLDTEQLRNLDYLLEAARENVQKALEEPEPLQPFGDEAGWWEPVKPHEGD